MSARPAVLSAAALAVGYGSRPLLGDLDLEVRPGRVTCLLGPNGSGKTTLLRTLTGLQKPLAGQVLLGGSDLSRMAPQDRARELAVVLTGGVDAGLLRVVDLVGLGRYPYTDRSGRLREHDRAAIRWAMQVTGVAPFAARAVSTLSDGERQRVLVARALAQEPALLALDEPTAFVDVPRRAELGDLLADLAGECGLAVLMTTHDLDLALRCADDVWLLVPDGDRSRLVVGGPEDLALEGAIGRAFASRDVDFDVERGGFVARRELLATGRVVGDGGRAVWARRALERAGLRLVAASERADVTVTVERSAWLVKDAHGPARLSRLADVVTHVRSRLPGLADVSDADVPGSR